MKRIFTWIACVLLIVGFSLPVYANSAQTWWSGVDGNGVVAMEEDSPIVVEHENLTFELSDLPEINSDREYLGKVTAEYAFYNPSEYTVTANLLFPFGGKPDYAAGYSDSETGTYHMAGDLKSYEITVDGVPVEKTVRYSFSRDISNFDLDRDLSLVRDDYTEDVFYSRDMPVTEYVYRVVWLEPEIEHADAIVTIPEPEGDMKIMLSGIHGMNTAEDGSRRFSAWGADGAVVRVYAIGGELEELQWSFYENAMAEESALVDGSMELTEVNVMTFEDLALMHYEDDCGVSRIDWYNAAVDIMNDTEYGGGFVSTDEMGYFGNMENYLMRWYQYRIQLEPGQRVVNEVTAPIYPMINGQYDPEIYEYSYLLSPASTWTEFGTLDISVNTPYHMLESGNLEFEKTDMGYALKMDGLPEGELVFTLCTEENPSREGSGISLGLLIILIPAAIMALLVYGMVKLCKVLAGRYM